MLTKHHFLSIFFSIAFLALATPVFVHATTQLYFQTSTSSVVAGETFSVRALLDSDQPVNAYDVAMNFSGPVMLENVNNANSLITVSQGAPNLSQAGEVSWRGGSIAPFSGTDGEILDLNFLADGTGTVSLSFSHGNIYLANGKGTEVTPSLQAATVTILASSTLSPGEVLGASAQAIYADTTPPKIQFLSIIPDPFQTNQKLLSFSVVDAESGIQSVQMRYRSEFFWSQWQTIQNPAPLSQNVWAVDFRTTDNAGNIAEEVTYDWGALSRSVGIAAAVIILIAVLLFFIFRPRNKYTDRG